MVHKSALLPTFCIQKYVNGNVESGEILKNALLLTFMYLEIRVQRNVALEKAFQRSWGMKSFC